VLLLVAMGFLLFRKGQDDKDAAEGAGVARASTPTLPDAVQTDPPAQAMQPVDPIPMLPPLPPQGRPPGILCSRRNAKSSVARCSSAALPLWWRVGGGEGQAEQGATTSYEQARRPLQAQNGNTAPAKVRRGPDVEDVSSASYIRARCAAGAWHLPALRAGNPHHHRSRRLYLVPADRAGVLDQWPQPAAAEGLQDLWRLWRRSDGKRVEVIWDRITTPNGIDVAMSSPGVDQLGGAGHPGQYSAHWGSRIASALMISLISDAFKYAAAEHGPETTTIANNGMTVQSPYESATAHDGALGQRGTQQHRRPPTVTINQGTIVNVYVAKDVDFTNVLNPAGNPTNDHGRRSVTLALVSSDFLRYQYEVLGIAEYMTSPEVTEICINRPGELYLETRAGWQRVDVPSLTFERARQFCTAVVNESNTGQRITDADPVVSLTFPTGQRAQFVIPPACDAGKVSITIRLPSKHTKSLSQYHEDGFFNQILESDGSISEQDRELLELRHSREYAEFFRRAVMYRKNIVVSGATGSGKTTFMKALVNHIPDNERLVTIEDARELFLTQPNVVHLLYSKGGQSTSNVSAKSCMEACLRMKPERIILAELRGDEAFYFIRNCASGHPGSITSCHAGSPEQTWDQLALMVKASAEGSGLEFNVIKRLLMMTIDIVVHIKAHAGSRYITGIDFNPGRAQGQEG
jgi:type IV secretion system protein VirB11